MSLQQFCFFSLILFEERQANLRGSTCVERQMLQVLCNKCETVYRDAEHRNMAFNMLKVVQRNESLALLHLSHNNNVSTSRNNV